MSIEPRDSNVIVSNAIRTLRAFNSETLLQIRTGAGIMNPGTGNRILEIRTLLESLSPTSARNALEARDLLLARCLLVELLDRRGHYRSATSLLPDHERYLGDVISTNRLPQEEGELLLFVEKAWYVNHKSVNDHRLHGSDAALDRAQLLYDHLNRLKLPARFADLRIRVCYTLARHLQDSDLNASERYYAEALEYCTNRLDAVFATSNDPNRREQETRFIHYTAGILTLGMARCVLRGDQLDRAARLCMMSQVLLRNTEEEVTRAFALFLRGSIHRRRNQFPRAVEMLDAALTVFARARHYRFFCRCRFELAMAHFGCERYPEAARVLASCLPPQLPKNEDDEAFRDNPNLERLWDIKAGLLSARIRLEQREFEDANKITRSVTASFADNDLGWTDDLRTEADLTLAEGAARIGAFHDAAIICSGTARRTIKDPEQRARLILLQWEISLRHDELDSAATYYEVWQKHSSSVSGNAKLQQRAAEFEREFQQKCTRGFFISGDTTDLNLARHREALRLFLIRRANLLHKKIGDRAEALGVERQTMANWLTEIRKSGTSNTESK